MIENEQIIRKGLHLDLPGTETMSQCHVQSEVKYKKQNSFEWQILDNLRLEAVSLFTEG